MPSPPSGSVFFALVGNTDLYYLTTDTGGVYDTKIYLEDGTVIADIPNGDAVSVLNYISLTPRVFYVGLAGSSQQTEIYATDATVAGTHLVTTVSNAMVSPFTHTASSEIYEVTTSAPASETIDGTLYNYTVYTSTLYGISATTGSPQAIAQVNYGTPFDETDGGFSSMSDYYGSPVEDYFTGTASALATAADGTPYTQLVTNFYKTDGTLAGTQAVLLDVTSVTALGSQDGRQLFNVVTGNVTTVYSADASGYLAAVLTLDGAYSAYLGPDYIGNQYLVETDSSSADLYATDGTAAGTQLLVSTPITSDPYAVQFDGSALGIDFFQFETPSGLQLYETTLTSATTHLVTTIPLGDFFAIGPLYDIMLPTPEGIQIGAIGLTGDGVVVGPQLWINPYTEAVAIAGDDYVWVGPLSGSWGTAANWEDTAPGSDPATVVPGSSDEVMFNSPLNQFQVIHGTGSAAYLTFSGENTITGALTAGVFWVSGYIGELQIDRGASLSAGDGLVDLSVTVRGSLIVGNSLTIQDYYGFDTGIATVVLVAGGTLDVGGTLTLSNDLYVVDGAHVQLGRLDDANGALAVDATSSVEIGDAGGASLGALTIDAGATVSNPQLGQGNIVDNGTVSFTSPGALLAEGYDLSGSGVVSLQGGAGVVVGGPVLAGSLAFQLGNGTSLTLDAVGAGNTIALSGNDVVALDGQQTYDPSTHAEIPAYDMQAVISGFDATDTLTLDTTITKATYIAGSVPGTGTLALTDGTTLVATVNLDGTYTGDTFLVTSVPSVGSDVTLLTGSLTLVAAPVYHQQAAPIGGLLLVDPASTAGETFSVTLSQEYAVLTASAPGASVTGEYTSVLTISGTLAQVNAALATVTENEPENSGYQLTLAASDSHGDTAARTVTVNGVSPPAVQAPVSATVVKGRAVAIGGVSIAEPDSPSGEVFTVSVTDQRGLLSAAGPGVSGSGTVTGLTITGTLAQVNAALATLTDTVSDGAPDKIQVFATDALGDRAHAGVIAVNVNASPVIAAPAMATVAVNQATRIAGISLSETGNTVGELFTVTLSDSAGLLTVGSSGVEVAGQGTTSLTVSGALPQVNAALATLLDTAPSTAADRLTVTASDSYGDSGTPAGVAVAVGEVTAPAATASIRATALHLGGVADAAWGSGEGGVTVSLLSGGTVIATSVTTSAGQANFGNLAAGTYQLQYTAPAGQGFVPGGPDSATGLTAPFSVAAGQALIAPAGDLIATLALNGSGLNATPAAGGYLVTGNAADSTLTLGSYNEFVTLTGGGDTVTTGNGNQAITLSGSGNTVSVGVGNSVINAGSGGAVVHAAGGDVTINATGTGNLLDGGSGLSFLNADGSGDNVFVLGAAGSPTANMTTISGFNVAAGDKLDMKNLISDTDYAPGFPDWTGSFSALAAGPNTVLALTNYLAPPTPFATLLNTHVGIDQLVALNAFTVT